MSQDATGYRALPEMVDHPSVARQLTEQEVAAMNTVEMESAPPQCDGHLGTAILHFEGGYIVHVRLQNHPDVRVVIPCTVTPKVGMDMIDGMFAQDAEEFVLQQFLGQPTDRLAVFGPHTQVPIRTYLQSRGIQTG